MRRYTTEDIHLFEERKPSEVFRYLTDLESFNRWWPKEVRFRVLQLVPALIGSKVEVHLGKRSFSAEIMSFEENKSVEWAYRSGLYKGRGHWALEEDEGDVRVKYTSDLPVHPSLIAEHFLNSRDFAAKHAKVLRRAFEGLQKRLEDAPL